MMQKVFAAFFFLVATVFAWFITQHLESGASIMQRVFSSLLSVSIFYTFFHLFLEEMVGKRITENKTRYSFRKVVSMLFIVTTAIVLLRIWIPNPEALLVAYGLVAAGIAVSLQDIIKNLAGGITIFFTGMYQVGNRIEVTGVYGDVIDIGLFNTTLMEIREWVGGDQATGRISTVPNGVVLQSSVKNYTKDHHYLWDEISLTVTGESDWKKSREILLSCAKKHTDHFVKEAEKSLSKLERRYYLEDRNLDPNVYLAPTKNGYTLSLRYVVEVRERRRVQSEIWQSIIASIDRTKKVSIAPVTYAVVDV